MFSALFFSYDGIYSGSYGLMIADFDTENVVETNSFSPNISSVNNKRLSRNYISEVSYDEPGTYEFSIISQVPIPLSTRREVLAWLSGQNEYKDIVFHQAEPDGAVLDDYKLGCIFKDIRTIYVNSNCVGFRLTAQFDSPFARGVPTVVTSNITSDDDNDYTEIIINNKSDINNYVYPRISYTMSSLGSRSTALSIVNYTDDPDGLRPMIITPYNSTTNKGGMWLQETITIDNDIKMITNSNSSKRGVLSAFNKTWVRLRKGKNVLRIYGTGSITITCPTYATIGL